MHGPEGRKDTTITDTIGGSTMGRGREEMHDMPHHATPCHAIPPPHHATLYHTVSIRFDSIRFEARQDKTRQDKTNNGARKEKGRGTDMKGIGGGRDEAGRQAGRHR
jgi:hypothetical protein